MTFWQTLALLRNKEAMEELARQCNVAPVFYCPYIPLQYYKGSKVDE